MTTAPVLLNVDLWEAWIDLQLSNDANCPTLYVMGDVYSDDQMLQPYLTRQESSDPTVLKLEIKPGTASEDGYVTEVLYAERLENIYRYQSIHIYLNDELITEIQDIEKLY